MNRTDFLRHIHVLSRPDREEAIIDAAVSGSAVAWPMVEIAVASADGKHRGAFRAAQDYFAVGTADDFVRVPMSPLAAQRIADRLKLVLPTTRMVELIWKQATVKLEPLPWGPPYDTSMLTVDRFVEHDRRVEAQRAGRGGLVRGHKKDVVLTNRLATQSAQVAIYGWHHVNGQPIQPLSLVHENTYADYSHGIGFVAPTMQLDGREVALADVLGDPTLAPLLSAEGALTVLRQPGVALDGGAVDARWHDYTKSLGERCVAWSRAEMARGVRDASPHNPAGPRIREYLAPCVRRATGRELGLTVGNWCAASACAAAQTCSVAGEAVPHGYRAAVIELREDAETNGCFRPAASARTGGFRPAIGDLALFHRGAKGSAEGHVARVETPPDDRARYRTIGGNEGPLSEWRLTERALGDDDLIGFIAYPPLAEQRTKEAITAAPAAPAARPVLPAPAVPAALPVPPALAAPLATMSIAPSAATVAEPSHAIGAVATRLESPSLVAPGPRVVGAAQKMLDSRLVTALLSGAGLAMVAVGVGTRVPTQFAWLIEIGLLCGAIAIVGLGVSGQAAGVLIDPQKLISLSRFQMVLWTVILLPAYFTIVLRRMALPDPFSVTLDWRMWALMGLSSVSLVGSPLLQTLKRTKDPQDGVTQSTADALGQPEEEVDAHARGILYGNPSIVDARLTDMFGGDEVGNAHLVDVHKVQLFFFTVLAAASYGVSIFRLLGGTPAAQITSFPELSTGLVAILGISHAAFLGGGAVRKTPLSTDVASAPAAPPKPTVAAAPVEPIEAAAPVGPTLAADPAEPTEAAQALRGMLESTRSSHDLARSLERSTSDQARTGDELLEAMTRLVTQTVGNRERSDRDLTRAIEGVADKLDGLQGASRVQSRGTEQILDAARRLGDTAKAQEGATRQLVKNTERLRKNVA